MGSHALSRFIHAASGPPELVLVRHAESVSNVAEREALAQGAPRIDTEARDADVPLTPRGRQQAHELAERVRSFEMDPPDALLSSPFRRAQETANPVAEALGLDLVLDERLRERDMGLLDGLTEAGLSALQAEEAERRSRVGKFYYTPPAGESIADVVLRVRSLLADLSRVFTTERVWVVTHQAVIMSCRYVLEGWDETRFLTEDEATHVANASMTRYRREEGGYRLL